MSQEHLGAQPLGGQPAFNSLRAALNGGAVTPEIVAIFQQIKNLRESDRSLRSIRRNLDLDNVPTLDPVDEPLLDEADAAAPSDLSGLLESFISLKQEKELLSDRLSRMAETTSALEEKVNQLTRLLEARTGSGDGSVA
jgi:DNA-binding transcriptional MerR regulator